MSARADRARLFFAVWPDEVVRHALAGLAREAQARSGGRAIGAEKVHLTLFFVGEVERTRLAALQRAAGTVTAAPFTLVLDRVGYWRHSRIVWAGAGETPPALAGLALDLKTALAREGVSGEDRPYVPHITLVRDARRKAAIDNLAPCVWEAREFVLVESVPSGGTVRYEPLTRWPLEGSTRDRRR